MIQANAFWSTGSLTFDANDPIIGVSVQNNGNSLLIDWQSFLGGDDLFPEGSASGDTIDGGGGVNTVQYSDTSSSSLHTIQKVGNAVLVTENGKTDTLYNIQVVYFPDGFVNMTNGVFYPTGGDADWIVLQNTSGPLALWRMSGTTIIGGGLAGNPGPTWHVEGTGHFLFGDGNTDIVWQNDNGSVAVWGIDGITVRGGGLVASNPGPTWHVEGTGHFFGDVYSDILFQNDNGSVAVWQMSGTNIVGGGLVASSPGPTWHVEGTGKFFNDGNSAILFQNDDGSVALWDMSGTNIVGGGLVTTSNPGPTWHIKGTGDFNFDGHTDIAFQNDNGTVAIWDMNGTNIIGGGVVTNPGTAWGVHDDNMQFTYSTTADETLAATPATPDEFVLTNFAAGSHTISGFNPVQDMIEFSKAQFGSFADVQEATSAISGGAMINLGNGSSLLLPGVNPASLHASDFALV
jgi:hypothetical protein